LLDHRLSSIDGQRHHVLAALLSHVLGPLLAVDKLDVGERLPTVVDHRAFRRGESLDGRVEEFLLGFGHKMVSLCLKWRLRPYSPGI
jgi:hypothetical protein